jgi:phasin family protein
MTAQKNYFSPEHFFNADAFKPFLSGAGYNQEEAMNQQRRNMEAFTAASKEAAEAAKTLAQCQTAFARESMEDIATFWRNWMSSGTNVQDKVEIQNQAAREGLAKAMAHNKEVTAIVQKTQEKVIRAFGDQVSENIQTATKAAKAK